MCRSYSMYNFHFRQIQNNIDGNHNDNNRRINELAAKLKGLFKDSHDGLDALNRRLLAECNGLKTLIAKPLSVYFTAYRAEDYTEGGEAYLTFQGIHHFCFTLGSYRNFNPDVKWFLSICAFKDYIAILVVEWTRNPESLLLPLLDHIYSQYTHVRMTCIRHFFQYATTEIRYMRNLNQYTLQMKSYMYHNNTHWQ